MAQKRRRNILDQVKGYRFARSKKVKAAREAIYHAQLHAFAHRKDKKNDFRRLWITRISAALFDTDMNYSRFIAGLKRAGVDLNRKMISELAIRNPEAFDELVETARAA